MSKKPINHERIERAHYDMDLPVPASDEEVTKAAVDMVKQIRKRASVLEDRRTVMANYRSQLEAIDERQSELADTVESHTKKRPVRVCEYLIVETSTIEVVRQDTGELVETRAADKEDLQENLIPGAKKGRHGDEAPVEA